MAKENTLLPTFLKMAKEIHLFTIFSKKGVILKPPPSKMTNCLILLFLDPVVLRPPSLYFVFPILILAKWCWCKNKCLWPKNKSYLYANYLLNIINIFYKV